MLLCCRKRAALLGTFSVECSSILCSSRPACSPHPSMPAIGQVAHVCTQKRPAILSAGKHKPDAVPHKACYDSNSPLVIPAREPQANLGRHTNADINAQQLSVLFRLLYCFLLQCRPAKYRWLVEIHQESYFICQLSVGPRVCHCTCTAHLPSAGTYGGPGVMSHLLVLRCLTSHSPDQRAAMESCF